MNPATRPRPSSRFQRWVVKGLELERARQQLEVMQAQLDQVEDALVLAALERGVEPWEALWALYGDEPCEAELEHYRRQVRARGFKRRRQIERYTDTLFCFWRACCAGDPRSRRTPRQRAILKALRGVLSPIGDTANRPERRRRERQQHAPMAILHGVDCFPRSRPARACGAPRPRSRERRSRPRCRSPGSDDPESSSSRSLGRNRGRRGVEAA